MVVWQKQDHQDRQIHRGHQRPGQRGGGRGQLGIKLSHNIL